MHNRIKNAFDGIQADEAFEKKLMTKVAKRRSTIKAAGFYRKAIAATATCLLVLCLGLVGYYLYFTPVTVISVDVNPSVELGINRFDKVVSIEAFNDEGEKIVNSVKVQHLNYKDAVDKLLDTTDFSKYAESEGLVYLTVFGDNTESDIVAEGLAEHTRSRSDVHCSHSLNKETKNAHSNGLSMGKYEAYLELKSVDPNVTVDEVKGLTMRQIKDRIRENDKDDFTEELPEQNVDRKESKGQHHGNGHGNGKNDKK